MKRMVCKLWALGIVWILGAFAFHANGQSAGPQAGGRERMAEMIEKRAEKLADDLGLKGDERASFLLTYQEYQQELMAHRSTPDFSPGMDPKKEAELTDEEAMQRIQAEFDRKAQRIVDSYNTLEVEKKYFEVFSKSLSAKQLMKIFVPTRTNRERTSGMSGRGRNNARQGSFGGGFQPGNFGMDEDW